MWWRRLCSGKLSMDLWSLIKYLFDCTNKSYMYIYICIIFCNIMYNRLRLSRDRLPLLESFVGGDISHPQWSAEAASFIPRYYGSQLRYSLITDKLCSSNWEIRKLTLRWSAWEQISEILYPPFHHRFAFEAPQRQHTWRRSEDTEGSWQILSVPWWQERGRRWGWCRQLWCRGSDELSWLAMVHLIRAVGGRVVYVTALTNYRKDRWNVKDCFVNLYSQNIHPLR